MIKVTFYQWQRRELIDDNQYMNADYVHSCTIESYGINEDTGDKISVFKPYYLGESHWGNDSAMMMQHVINYAHSLKELIGQGIVHIYTMEEPE